MKGQKLQLEYGNGKVVVVKPSDIPYQVQDAGKAPGVLTNLVSWAGEWFNKKVEDGTAQPEVTVVVQSGEGRTARAADPRVRTLNINSISVANSVVYYRR